MLEDFGNSAENFTSRMDDVSYPVSLENILSEVELSLDEIGGIFHKFLIEDSREPILQSALGAVQYAMKAVELQMDVIPVILPPVIDEFRHMYHMQEYIEDMEYWSEGKIFIIIIKEDRYSVRHLLRRYLTSG